MNEKYSYIVDNLEYFAKDKRHKDYLRLYMEEAANAIRELTHQRETLNDTQEAYVKMCLCMEQPLDRMMKDAVSLRECAVRNVNWNDVETVSKFVADIGALFKEIHRYVETKIKDEKEVL